MHYFAYGSNLHPVRLMKRVPSAELIGVVTHQSHRLVFHKKSHDGSGKCNILNTGSELDLVYGAVYKIKEEHKEALDRFEGEGYVNAPVVLHHDEQQYACFTYHAHDLHIVDNLKPYHWYKQLVLLGAKYLRFPDKYITALESVESIQDPDVGRRSENEELIERILKYS